jgi:hypothetical protein
VGRIFTVLAAPQGRPYVGERPQRLKSIFYRAALRPCLCFHHLFITFSAARIATRRGPSTDPSFGLGKV